MGKKSPDEIDIGVGNRIRLARKEAGVSQVRLADWLGVTFQQVHKYERGANRISPSKLVRIADRLGKTVAWFYGPTGEKDDSGDAGIIEKMLLTGNRGIALARAFVSVDASTQASIVAIAAQIAEAKATVRAAA